MECKLGKVFGCEGLKADGTCSVYYDEGVALRMDKGECIFKNIRAPKVGIHAVKGGKKRNPLKAAKAEARNAAAAEA